MMLRDELPMHETELMKTLNEFDTNINGTTL